MKRPYYLVTFRKVKKSADGKRVMYRKKGSNRVMVRELVAGELLSPQLCDRYNVPPEYVDTITVPSSSVYWFGETRRSTHYPD